MEQIELLDIKLNQMQIFLTAAQTLNFSAAGELLGYTQPMISRTIKGLEESLGIILFIRDQKHIQLTPAGQELYRQWKNIIRQVENSISDAHKLQEGYNQILRFGIGTLARDPEVVHLRECVQKLPQNIIVQCECSTADTLWKRIENGQLDLILASGHSLPMDAKRLYHWRILEESYLSVFIPCSNPLSKLDDISMADLKGERFICVSPEVDRNYAVLLNELTSEAGFVPRVACYLESDLSVKINLKMGNGIVLADSRTGLEDHDIRKYELKAYRNDILLVWRKENDNPILQQFLDLL